MNRQHYPHEPSPGVLLRCFLRCYLVGANFNTRGMQNIGLIYAMEPGLAAIHRDPERLVEARRRYLEHYNTHPFWTPLLVGMFLSLERAIARGTLPSGMLENVRVTTTYTLSAIGDSVFGGGVQVFWALAAGCLILSGHAGMAVVLGCVLLAGLQTFKVVTFFTGFREGFTFLPRLKRLDLINWGRRLKYVNSVLLVLLWTLAWPGEFHGPGWLAAIAGLSLAAMCVKRTGLPREAALILILGWLAIWAMLLASLTGVAPLG